MKNSERNTTETRSTVQPKGRVIAIKGILDSPQFEELFESVEYLIDNLDCELSSAVRHRFPDLHANTQSTIEFWLIQELMGSIGAGGLDYKTDLSKANPY